MFSRVLQQRVAQAVLRGLVCQVAHHTISDDIRDQFAALDPEGTGQAGVAALRELLRSERFSLSDGEVERLLSQLDVRGGSIGFDPCTRAGYFGTCDHVTGDGENAKVWLYPGATIQSQAGAMTACSNIGGTYVVNDAAPPATSYYSCGTTSYCVQVMGPLTMDQLASATADLTMDEAESQYSAQCSELFAYPMAQF